MGKLEQAEELASQLVVVRDHLAAILPDDNKVLTQDLAKLPMRTIDGLLDVIYQVKKYGWPQKPKRGERADRAGLIGRKISNVRPMTREEAENEGWDHLVNTMHWPPVVVELDDQTILYASRDPEGNGYGCLFGCDEAGLGFRLLAKDCDVYSDR